MAPSATAISILQYCCSQTRYVASSAILEGKPGPTEGAQRMSSLEYRKLFASSEAAERFEIWGAHRTQSQAHTSSLLVFSKMSFALFVCTNKPLCNVYSVRCVRNRLMAMQEEAVV